MYVSQEDSVIPQIQNFQVHQPNIPIPYLKAPYPLIKPLTSLNLRNQTSFL